MERIYSKILNTYIDVPLLIGVAFLFGRTDFGKHH